MLLKRIPVPAILVAGLVLTLPACGSGSNGSSTSGSPTSTSTTSKATPTVTATTPAARKPLTKATLTKALLAQSDMPTGFVIDSSEPDEQDGISLTNSRCKQFAKLLNTKSAPGSTATVSRIFTGGQSGPFVEEDLDALPSAPAARALVEQTAAAIRSCKQAKLTLPGDGSSQVTISQVSIPKVGNARIGVRIVADGGDLDGFQVTFVMAALGDVVLSMAFDNPTHIDGTVSVAARKATEVLDAAKADR
ncbi:sensor domain-containing protein [Kribbella sp. VKM Ac-2566]|uniref:sensor domain-containing protein n=1 Tax=Kribbella sp. VKM Ac-2566 TaxID=2512218 RepID=UPI0010629387|nr:sensor domain-containing protein [Kribbella sp. VKM Ac-2566]TDX08307.1 PknH-like protein [Kribbella sp. VKM Ac-2566]